MNEQNSYGTGRAPEKKPTHLPIILLLLVAFASTHFITYIHRASESAQAQAQKNDALLLPEQADPEDAALLPDGCGLGLTLGELTDPQRRYWSLPSGVYIEEIDENGSAYAAGLRAGDVLVRIGQDEVHNTSSCTDALQQQAHKEFLTLHYYREGTEYSVDIPLNPDS